MFWKKKPATEEASKAEKLPGPRSIEELVGRQLVLDLKKDPDWVWQLKSVVRKRSDGPQKFDFRVFDAAQTKVKDYTSLDSSPALVLYYGWFDKISMEVHFGELAAPVTSGPVAAATASVTPSASGDVRIFTENEIWQKVTALNEPGSTVFFYLSGSPASGGPLGRGAAVVELNPNYPGKHQKRYILYTDDVNNGGQPVGKRQRFRDYDSSKEVAKWIKERHEKQSHYSGS